jgi:hypothetical protein
MSRIDKYRRFRDLCMARADEAKTDEAKAQYLAMATAWSRLIRFEEEMKVDLPIASEPAIQ